MFTFANIEDAKRIVEAGIAEYDRNPKSTSWETPSNIGTHAVTVRAWMDGGLINAGLTEVWKFTGSQEELVKWWVGLGKGHVFRGRAQKGLDSWQVNLQYQKKRSGNKAFNFHLEVPARS